MDIGWDEMAWSLFLFSERTEVLLFEVEVHTFLAAARPTVTVASRICIYTFGNKQVPIAGVLRTPYETARVITDVVISHEGEVLYVVLVLNLLPNN